MRFYIYALILVFHLSSCGGNTNDTGCKMGSPEAIFSTSLNGFENHSFKLVQNNGTETFDYNGSPVVIYQTGCDQISQEFQFTFENKTGSDSEAMMKIANILSNWSKLGQKQEMFGSWAQQIRMVSEDMQLGQSFSPAPNIEIAMDRVNQAVGEILTLTLIQKG